MEFLVTLLSTITKYVPVLWLTLITFRSSFKFSTTKNIIITSILTSIVIALSHALIITNRLEGMNESLFSMAVVIMSIFSFYFFLNYVTKNVLKIIFTLFLVKSITDCIVLTARIYYEFILSDMSLVKMIDEHFVAKLGFSDVIFHGVIMLISTPPIYLIIKHLLRPVLKVTDNMPFWKYLWLIPTSFFTIFRFLVYPGYFQNSNLSNKYILFLSPLWIIFMYLVYLIVLKMLLQTAKNLQLQKEIELSNVHMEMQKSHYNALQKSIFEMRRAEHDTRHHITTLQSYLKNNDIASIEKFLNVNMSELESNNYTQHCQNYVIDSILWNFEKRAKENSISFNVKVNISDDTFVTPIDLSILFGNLIENGIEACCRQMAGEKFLDISAAMVSSKTMGVCIKNSYEGEIYKNENAFLSSKRDDEGIGVKSVQSIVNKYNGSIKLDYCNNVFEVQVLLSAP